MLLLEFLLSIMNVSRLFEEFHLDLIEGRAFLYHPVLSHLVNGYFEIYS